MNLTDGIGEMVAWVLAGCIVCLIFGMMLGHIVGQPIVDRLVRLVANVRNLLRPTRTQDGRKL